MRTLKEITAMRVDRGLSRLELNAFIGTFELGHEVKKCFNFNIGSSKYQWKYIFPKAIIVIMILFQVTAPAALITAIKNLCPGKV